MSTQNAKKLLTVNSPCSCMKWNKHCCVPKKKLNGWAYKTSTSLLANKHTATLPHWAEQDKNIVPQPSPAN